MFYARLNETSFEGAVAAIVIEEIAFGLEAPGAALHQNAFEAAEFVAAELGEIVHVEMRIAGDRKDRRKPSGRSHPSGAGHEAAAADAGFFSDVLELQLPRPW